MGNRATNIPAPGVGRATTSPGPQQMGGFGGVQGLAPWLRQGTAPLSPMTLSDRASFGSMSQPGPLAGQQALAQQVSQAPTQSYQEWVDTGRPAPEGSPKAIEQASAQSLYDRAWQQHLTMGGVQPDLYAQLTQDQKDRLAVQAIQYGATGSGSGGWSVGGEGY